MEPTDFFSDVVRSGGVLGVDWTDEPDAVVGRLGPASGEDRQARRLLRDHGGVDFRWHRHRAGRPWLGVGFTVQVHRLRYDPTAAAGTTAVEARYGRLPSRLRFDELRERLAAVGVPVEEVPGVGTDLRRFWQPDSTALIQVVADDPDPDSGDPEPKTDAPDPDPGDPEPKTDAPDPETGRVDQEARDPGRRAGEAEPRTGGAELRAGDVWAISAPYPVDAVVLARSPRSGGDRARHLRRLDAGARRDWLRRHGTGAAAAPDWWLSQFREADIRLAQRPADRADWVELRLWLLGEAAVHGVLDAREVTERRASFVAGLFAHDLADGLDGILPTGDELVRACLDAIPATPGEIRAAGDWRRLDRAGVLRLRRTRNLLASAAPHLPRVADLALAAELERRVAHRPELR